MDEQHSPEDELAKKVNEAARGNVNKAQEVSADAGHGKEEKQKPKSTLESVVDETSHLFGSAVKLGLAGALPMAQAIMLPEFKRDTAVLTGAQIASDYTTSLQTGRKYTAGSLLESAAIGTAITVPLEVMFRTANAMPLNTTFDYFAKAAVWGGIAYPAFNGIYLPVAYLIRNRTFKGMGKYVKENYWSIMKKSWKYLIPFSLLNVFFVPAALQIPISALISFVYDRFTAQKGEVPEHQKRDKTPYLVAASSAVGKLAKNIFYGIPNAAYAIGSSIRDLYKSSAKPATSTPAVTPAHS